MQISYVNQSSRVTNKPIGNLNLNRLPENRFGYLKTGFGYANWLSQSVI